MNPLSCRQALPGRNVGLLRYWLVAAVVLPAPAALFADDPLLTVEVRQPMRAVNHPLVAQAWEHVSESRQFQERLASPEFDRLHQTMRFLERATGLDWQTALERLTARGVVLTVNSAQPPRADLVVTASDAELLSRVHEFVRTQLRVSAPGRRLEQLLAETDHRGTTCYRLGDAHYALAGERLIVSTTAEQLHERLDQSPPPGERSQFASVNEPLLIARLNLEKLREFPEFARAVALPSDDPGRTAFLGGWFDLLRAGNTATARISPDPAGFEIAVRVDAAADDLADGLSGFFAATDRKGIAPLLDLPGMLYSATWYRDWGSLWDARGELLQTEAREKLEKGNDDVRKQFSAFKIDFIPSELMSALGPRFRVVLARQNETPYKVELNERLPAGLLAIELNDEEKFRAQATPLMRVVGLLSAFGRPGLLTRKASYRDAELTGMWYADDEKSAASGNRVRFNFNPTSTITRGWFLLGSTDEIVRNAIDVLEREAGNESLPGVTEAQVLSLTEAASALGDFDDAIVRGSVFQNGWTIAEAEEEMAVLRRILEAVGRIRTQAGFRDGGFEYQVRVGNVD